MRDSAMSGDQRLRAIGRLGGLSTSMRHDSSQYTQPAREAFERRWERLVDPEGTLAPAERARRAEAARRQHFSRLAYRSAETRRKKARRANGLAAALEATEAKGPPSF